jgi:hypothetical protein
MAAAARVGRRGQRLPRESAPISCRWISIPRDRPAGRSCSAPSFICRAWLQPATRRSATSPNRSPRRRGRFSPHGGRQADRVAIMASTEGRLPARSVVAQPLRRVGHVGGYGDHQPSRPLRRGAPVRRALHIRPAREEIQNGAERRQLDLLCGNVDLVALDCRPLINIHHSSLPVFIGPALSAGQKNAASNWLAQRPISDREFLKDRSSNSA